MNDLERILENIISKGELKDIGYVIQLASYHKNWDSNRQRINWVDKQEQIIAKAIEQYIIKARIDTAERIKGNCESEAERIWIMHYIEELKKGIDNGII